MNTPEDMLATTDRHESPSVGSRILGSGFASLFLGTPFLSLFTAPGGPAWTLALLALATTLFALSSCWQQSNETSREAVHESCGTSGRGALADRDVTPNAVGIFPWRGSTGLPRLRPAERMRVNLTPRCGGRGSFCEVVVHSGRARRSGRASVGSVREVGRWRRARPAASRRTAR